jgi:2-dehydro-3-deoxyphosphogluconate aldolase / (4S)-4-hydroxy-2-oxoglutarate aldolase
MQKSVVLAKITETGLIPIVRVPSADDALRVVEAIQEGGVPILEITMTVPGAVGVIEELAKRSMGDVLVGAGTVLDAETARACILAGANFIVSPSLDEGTVACCRRYAVPVLPGALTPTEVVRAWQAGADMVKVFPCGAVGGASYVKALKAPLPHIDLVPTGGVTLDSIGDFIRAGAAAVGVGADLVDMEALHAGDAKSITENARRFLAAVKSARAKDGA